MNGSKMMLLYLGGNLQNPLLPQRICKDTFVILWTLPTSISEWMESLIHSLQNSQMWVVFKSYKYIKMYYIFNEPISWAAKIFLNLGDEHPQNNDHWMTK